MGSPHGGWVEAGASPAQFEGRESVPDNHFGPVLGGLIDFTNGLKTAFQAFRQVF